jgi:hypothetical protein
VPHAPQFWKLTSRSTQALLQSVVPTSQEHCPTEQICPAGQTLPHAPQLATSLWVSTQLAPHSTSGDVHPAAQFPVSHTWFAPQTLPQVPQFAGSCESRTQLPPQSE